MHLAVQNASTKMTGLRLVSALVSASAPDADARGADKQCPTTSTPCAERAGQLRKSKACLCHIVLLGGHAGGVLNGHADAEAAGRGPWHGGGGCCRQRRLQLQLGRGLSRPQQRLLKILRHMQEPNVKLDSSRAFLRMILCVICIRCVLLVPALTCAAKKTDL